jgi:cardiolipin synthase
VPEVRPDSTQPGDAGACVLHAQEQALVRSLRVAPSTGNRVSALVDGPQTYAAMFLAIESAREHINLQGRLVEAGGIGSELARRLVECCMRGLRVHLLPDAPTAPAHASWTIERLRRAGVVIGESTAIQRVRALGQPVCDERFLLLADGRRAVIGSVHASDRFPFTPVTHAGPGWRDTQLAVEGPLVATLQELFIRQWRRSTHVAMRGGTSVPQSWPSGAQRVSVAASREGRCMRTAFHAALLAAIDAAQHRVLLSTAQLVPTHRLLRALTHAARRGVEVHVLLPDRETSGAPWQAGHAHYGALLASGAHLHERHDSRGHARASVIDGVWTTVGVSTLDWRRCAQASEPTLIVLDAGFGSEMEQVFGYDMAHCREVATCTHGGHARGPLHLLDRLAQGLQLLS